MSEMARYASSDPMGAAWPMGRFGAVAPPGQLWPTYGRDTAPIELLQSAVVADACYQAALRTHADIGQLSIQEFLN